MNTVTLTEGDIRIEFPQFPGVRKPAKFDDGAHGMSHCLKAVDFLRELPDAFWLVEVKDPEDSHIPAHLKPGRVADFKATVSSPPSKCPHCHQVIEDYFKATLAQKLKDTIFYLHLDERLPDKPVKYLVLAGLSSLDAAMLLNALDRLKKACGDPKQGIAWQRGYGVAFLNLEAWNKRFPDCPAKRMGNH